MIYRLSVEMADRVSARRAIASSFFLRAKFLVIHEMEKQLPVAPYTDEWKILDTDDVPLNERYAALGLIEQAVPVVFLAINLVALVWNLK